MAGKTITEEPMANSTYGMIDRAMQEPVRALQQYNRTVEEAQEPLPFQTITGPSAESINNGQTNMGTFEYLARGGIENSAKKVTNQIVAKRRQQQMRAQFEQLLEMNEKGADILYNDAVQTYGDAIKNWIPPKTFFYDQKTGAFMPYKYAEHVAYGVNMFEKAKQKALQRQQAQTIVGSAQSRQQAAAGMIGSGLNPDDYKQSLEAIPTANDLAAPKKTAAEIDELKTREERNRAQAGYYNRMPKAGGGSGKNTTPAEIINTLEKRRLEYEKLLQDKRNELRSPNKGTNPDVDQKILNDIRKIERTIGGIEREIEQEKMKSRGEDPTNAPSGESMVMADSIRGAVQSMLSKGYSLDDRNLMIYDNKGNPVPGAYDQHVVWAVLDMMDRQKIKLPGLGEDQGGRADKIRQSIKTYGLEATIDALTSVSLQKPGGVNVGE